MYNCDTIFRVAFGLAVLSATHAFATTITPVDATASSAYDVRYPRNTINGNALTGNVCGNDQATMWESSIGQVPAYIAFKLGGQFDLTGTHVWNYNESHAGAPPALWAAFGAKDVTILVSSMAAPDPTNASHWKSVSYAYNGVPATTFQMAPGAASTNYTGEDYTFTASKARWVLFNIASNFAGDYSTVGVGLSQVRFDGVAATPEPSMLMLTATSLISLVVYAWRRRK